MVHEFVGATASEDESATPMVVRIPGMVVVMIVEASLKALTIVMAINVAAGVSSRDPVGTLPLKGEHCEGLALLGQVQSLRVRVRGTSEEARGLVLPCSSVKQARASDCIASRAGDPVDA